LLDDQNLDDEFKIVIDLKYYSQLDSSKNESMYLYFGKHSTEEESLINLSDYSTIQNGVGGP
jgi:hypothetical protein